MINLYQNIFYRFLIFSVLPTGEKNIQNNESLEHDASNSVDDEASTTNEETKVININDIDIDVDWGDLDKMSNQNKGMW